MCALASIIGYLDKRKLYKVFETDLIPLLDIVYTIQDKQNSKFNCLFADLYHLLFNGCYTFANLSKVNCKLNNRIKMVSFNSVFFHFFKTICLPNISIYFWINWTLVKSKKVNHRDIV